MRKLEYGELLEVGDTVLVDNIFFKRSEVITKVTKTMAIHEGDYKTRYKRKYDSFFGYIPYDREQALFDFTVMTNRE